MKRNPGHAFPDPSQFDAINSPQLVVFDPVVEANLDAMVGMVAERLSVDALRPHLKTHKSERITRQQIDRGVVHFKASTMGEVAMAARAGAKSVLLAHQPVGEKMHAIAKLARQYPETSISVIVDDMEHARRLRDEYLETMGDSQSSLQLMIDVDAGMHRTGIPMGDSLLALWSDLASEPGIKLLGLHVYDGHLHQSGLGERRQGVDDILSVLLPILKQVDVGTVVVGGTPTFSVWVDAGERHRDFTRWQFSPGTCTLWDWGYNDAYDDLPFTIGAAVLTRVVSHPMGLDDADTQCVCLDVGTKATACEMPLVDRVRIHGVPEARLIAQSEEHLVVSVSKDRGLPIGTALWALPKHICPTVARYERALFYREADDAFAWQPIEPRDGMK